MEADSWIDNMFSEDGKRRDESMGEIIKFQQFCKDDDLDKSRDHGCTAAQLT